jgi:iron complex outermembrane receptor protein
LGDVQYVDNTLDQYNVPRHLAAAGGRVPLRPGTEGGLPVYTIDCSGKPGLNSPRWSLNGGIRQDVPLGDYTLQLSLDGRYRSNRVIGFEYLAQHNSGDDFTADASIAFGPQDQSWQLTAWVRNLTDNNVRILTQYNNNVGGVIATSYAAAPHLWCARIGEVLAQSRGRAILSRRIPRMAKPCLATPGIKTF